MKKPTPPMKITITATGAPGFELLNQAKAALKKLLEKGTSYRVALPQGTTSIRSHLAQRIGTHHDIVVYYMSSFTNWEIQYFGLCRTGLKQVFGVVPKTLEVTPID